MRTLRLAVRRAHGALVLVAASSLLSGCGETVRRTGQIELFAVPADLADTGRLVPALRAPAPALARARVEPRMGDAIRYPDDVVTIQVPSVYLDHLYLMSSGDYSMHVADVILFSEVWENAAQSYDSPSLNRVVFVARDQHIPGRLNFTQNIAYGPTSFKGHPLKVKFTVMVLRKEKGKRASTAAETIGNFLSSAAGATPYGGLVSSSVSVVREILRNQANVIAFDFEATFFADNPLESKDTILQISGAVTNDLKKSQPAFSALASAVKETSPPTGEMGFAIDPSKSFLSATGDGSTKTMLAELDALARRDPVRFEASLRSNAASGPRKEEYAKALAAYEPFRDSFAEASRCIGHCVTEEDRKKAVLGAFTAPTAPEAFVRGLDAATTSAGALNDAWKALKEGVQETTERKLLGAPSQPGHEGAGHGEASPGEPNGAGGTKKDPATDGLKSDRNVAWLQYGTYALIETEERCRDNNDASTTTRRLFPLNHLDHFVEDGGWVCRPREDQRGDPGAIAGLKGRRDGTLENLAKAEQSVRAAEAEVVNAAQAIETAAKECELAAPASASPALDGSRSSTGGAAARAPNKAAGTADPAKAGAGGDQTPEERLKAAQEDYAKKQAGLESAKSKDARLRAQLRAVEDELGRSAVSEVSRYGSSVPDDRLQSNYLIFRVMAGPLKESPETLAEASRKADDLIHKLAGEQTGDQLESALKGAQAEVAAVFGRERLESKARSIAKRIETTTVGSDARTAEFNKQLDDFITGFTKGASEDFVKRMQAVAAELKASWAQRFSEIKPK
jgi:hypothetical protein